MLVTVTTGFRHSSIETAERILQKISDESKAFTIVETLRQPKIVIPKKPTPPRALAADADDNAKKRFEADTARFQEAMAKWTPEMEATMKQAQEDTKTQIIETLKKLSPAALDEAKIDGLIFANTTGDLPLPDKEGLIKWIENGHALMGMHSATDTLRMFPGYTSTIGGEFAGHQWTAPLDLIAMDPKHPATEGIASPSGHQTGGILPLQRLRKSAASTICGPRPNRPWTNVPIREKRNIFQSPGFAHRVLGRLFYTSLGHREDIWDDGEIANRI